MDDQTSPPSDETRQGQWTVDILDEPDFPRGVIVQFVEMGMSGVESFETVLPPEHALAFSLAVAERARELM